ncbi:ABC transporter substrate-binding protein [Agromyces archimandritae]|uniref:Solute-binding protein family 5 domain-containing protein n=1 Tax=Agromyces archimandritae TaxID=2781962 RepID=A0A975FPB7_9MICO|nr:ABC transporter substrate-binding protein [Agromyces archimandritae]QTX05636.1 hypothetical protein G127AT_05370 [Agromyces archimandritae]
MTTAALLVSGCASSSDDRGGDADRGDTLTIGLAAAPTSLNPADMNQSANQFAMPAYDSLIFEESSGELVPGLATEWGYTDDENRVFELKIRDGVTFSDGEELTAEAVAEFFDFFTAGSSNMANLISGGTYEAIDDETVRMSWDTPHPLVPQSLTQRFLGGMVVSPKAMEDPDTLSTSTAGTGPYTLVPDETITGNSYVYEARDDYWSPDNQLWDRIVIKVIETTDQRVNGLKAGELDLVAGDLTTAESAEAAGFTVGYAPFVFVGLSLLDRDGTLGTPLADVRVRQAINYALDRDTVAEALLGTYGEPTEQTVTSAESGYVEELAGHYAYDPEQAKRLLAEAGYPDGFSLPVVAVNNPTQGALAQVITEQLSKVGIAIDLVAEQSDGYFQKMSGGEYPAAVIGYGSQPMWMEYQGLYGPDAAFNGLKAQRDELDELFTKAAAAGDPAEQRELNEQTERYLVEEAWFAPLALMPNFWYSADTIQAPEVTVAVPSPVFRSIAPAE